MELTEEKIAEALGVGVKEQEPTDPAENTQTAGGDGGNDQAIAEPENTQPQTDGAGQQPAEGGAEGTEAAAAQQVADKQTQTPEERRRNAAQRRQRERQEAIDSAVAQALEKERQQVDAQLKQVLTAAGIVNAETGQVISSMAELKAWAGSVEAQRLQQELRSGKLSEATLSAIVSKHPTVQRAEQLVQQMEQQAAAQRRAQAQAQVEKEIAEIHKLDASVGSLEDLLAKPYGKELMQLVEEGESLTEAHYQLNRDRLEQAKNDALVQKAMNDARGKAHMRGTGGQIGGGGVTVPAEVARLYRQMMPGISEAEIQKAYNQYIKGG